MEPMNPSKTEKTAPVTKPDESQNEGEGSRSADRHYREGVRKTVESGKVGELAKEAKEAVEGPEGDALRRAEEEAKKRGNAVPRGDRGAERSAPRH
jgi:hypothetical protein